MYGSMGTCPGDAYNSSCFMVYCTGILYCLNQEVGLLYMKKQIPNERLYRAQLESASQ